VIVFKRTTTISGKSFMVFGNENGAEHSFPVDEDIASYFMHNFNILSPGKEVEDTDVEGSKGD